jgi:hypothetical protein
VRTLAGKPKEGEGGFRGQKATIAAALNENASLKGTKEVP